MAKCRSCGADIVWLKTTAGKNMPVDADGVSVMDVVDGSFTDDGKPVFDPQRHTSHFATCPNADEHRKPR